MPVSQGTLSTMRYLKAAPIRSLAQVALTARQSAEMEMMLRRAIVFYLECEPRSLRATFHHGGTPQRGPFGGGHGDYAEETDF
jgi:hypothetical protein